MNDPNDGATTARPRAAASKNGGDRYAPWRDSCGRFTDGHPGGPGRPPAIDLRHLVERRFAADALVEGSLTLEDALVGVVRVLFDQALGGDLAAARLLLERLTTSPETAAAVKVNVDARRVQIGPPSPPRRERAAQLLEVHRIIAEIEKDQGEKAVASLLDEPVPPRPRLPAVQVEPEPAAVSSPSAAPPPTPPPPAPRPFCPPPAPAGSLREQIETAYHRERRYPHLAP